MRASTERRRRKAIERQNKGNIGLLAETVDDQQWISQFAATEILGTALVGVGLPSSDVSTESAPPGSASSPTSRLA